MNHLNLMGYVFKSLVFMKIKQRTLQLIPTRWRDLNFILGGGAKKYRKTRKMKYFVYLLLPIGPIIIPCL